VGRVREFFKNIENYKIYNLILVATAAFIMILGNSFFGIRDDFKDIAEKNRIFMANKIQYIIESWILERINSIEITARYFDHYYDSEKNVQDFLAIYLEGNKYFDAVQFLVPDKYFYVNDKKMDDYIEGYTYGYGDKHYYKEGEDKWYLDMKWFQNTRSKLKTTIEVVENHGLFYERAFNICTPVSKDYEFKGVFCGSIKAKLLFDKIKDLKVPDNIYYFIGDKDGNIFAQAGGNKKNLDYKLAKIREQKTADGYLIPNDMHVENDIVSMDTIANFDWYIAVGIDGKNIENKIIKHFLKYALIVFLCFTAFIIIINGSYLFLHRRAEARKKEYKKLLEYNSRMSEVGALVSAINHQLRQPLNALMLIISNTIQLLEAKTLNKKDIKDNLTLSQRSIGMMNKTINIYRNFYRISDDISEFELIECVESVLYVMHTNFAQNNIAVNMNSDAISGLKICSSENFIQQILLVLMQNAKDSIAAMPLNTKDINSRVIEIKFDADEENVMIFISDFGGGITDKKAKNLFSPLNRSQKPNGFGMGLSFAKKLAKEKLMGDVTLVNNTNPTTFVLKIKKNIREIT
jgi:signal transduction histidine kinase